MLPCWNPIADLNSPGLLNDYHCPLLYRSSLKGQNLHIGITNAWNTLPSAYFLSVYCFLIFSLLSLHYKVQSFLNS